MKRQELFLFVSSAANCQSCNTVLRLFLRGGFLCFVFIAKDLGYCFLEKMSVYSVLFSLFYKFSVILACWAVLTHSIGSTTFIKIRLHEMLKFNVLLLIVVWKTSWSEARNQKKVHAVDQWKELHKNLNLNLQCFLDSDRDPFRSVGLL